MARNPNDRETVTVNAATETKPGNERRDFRAGRETDFSSAGARKLLELDSFARVINDWKQLADCTRHQLELLDNLNRTLQKELAELAEKEAQSRHSAFHDGLTGLPNRSLLQDRFQQAKTQADRDHKPVALLLLDLDQFKHVNDELGHASGDELLQEVALRMTKAIRGADTACRYGGDEFVIMLPVIEIPDTATTLASEIGRRLCEPYLIAGHIIQMSVSIGVAVYPDDGQTFDHLMKQADSAMYRDKRTDQRAHASNPQQEVPATDESRNPLAADQSTGPHGRAQVARNEPINIHRPPKKH